MAGLSRGPVAPVTLSIVLLALLALLLPHGATALDNGVGLTPAMGLSTWNHFGGSVSDQLLRELADAMNSSGLVEAGYMYLNLDDGWAYNRTADGTIQPDPTLFPNGMKPVVDYIHSRGLKFGIYTARGSRTCLGRPGSDQHETQDANTYAQWGVDYLKEDSCGGSEHGTVWEQYARMRDALNATGRHIYFSVTQAVDFDDNRPALHCYGRGSAFTTIPWVAQGLDPTSLANSYLVEYCNNEDFFGYTDGTPQPGGFLSNLDSQQLLTYDNLTVRGAYNDNDMLEVCNGGQTDAEYRSQFSTWSILTSPLILGNDPRSMSQACLDVILNREVIAVNQDPLVSRGKLVYQWPMAHWPNNTWAHASASSAGPSEPYGPPMAFGLKMAPCNASLPAQRFLYNATTQFITTAEGFCLTYGGYHENNFGAAECTGWSAENIGSQKWLPFNDSTIRVVDNLPKNMDLFDCSFANGSVQVCTNAGSDCYSTPGGPAGCGMTGQHWQFSSGRWSTIASAVDGFSHCVETFPLPPPAVDIRIQIWTKPLHDGSAAAVAFNRYPEPINATITWEMLGKDPAVPLSVRDLWQHTNIGTFKGSFTATVQPHDVVMIIAK